MTDAAAISAFLPSPVAWCLEQNLACKNYLSSNPKNFLQRPLWNYQLSQYTGCQNGYQNGCVCVVICAGVYCFVGIWQLCVNFLFSILQTIGIILLSWEALHALFGPVQMQYIASLCYYVYSLFIAGKVCCVATCQLRGTFRAVTGIIRLHLYCKHSVAFLREMANME